MTQYFGGSGGGALSRAHSRMAARQQAQQAAARKQAAASKKKKDDGFSLGDLVPNLGVGELVDMVPGVIGGVVDLATGEGGYGHAWGNFGKGLLSSVASTGRVIGDVATLGAAELPIFGGRSVMDIGSDNLGDFLASNDAEKEAGTYKPSGIDKYWEHGILPSLVEDVGNVAIGAGAAAKLSKIGTVGRLAEAGRTAEIAGKAGFEAADVARAAEAAGTKGLGKFKDAGIGNQKLVRAGKAAAKATGLEAPEAAVAARASRLTTLEHAAHPYKALFNEAISPLARAGQEAKLAKIAAPVEDAAAVADDVVPETAPAVTYSTAPGVRPMGETRTPLQIASDEAAAAVAQQEASPRSKNDALLAGNTEAKVTMYRGEPAANAGAARGEQFFPEYGYAENFARTSGDGGIVYQVEVPKSVADAAAARAAEAAARGEQVQPGTHILPPEWADAAYPDQVAPGALDAAAALDETGKARAQAPHANTPETPVEAQGTPPRIGPHEDTIRRLANEPIPAWAKKVVARLPERGVNALDRVEGFIEGRQTASVVNERRRMMEAARRELFHDPAVRTLVTAASEHLVGRTTHAGVEITPDVANQMIGNAAIMRLDATNMLEKALAGGAGVEELHRIIGAEGSIIPPELLTPALSEAIDAGVEQWRGLFEKRVDILRGGRLGAKGLENIGDDIPLMSKREVQLWNQVQRDLKRSERLNDRIASETARGVAQVERSSAKVDTLDALIENLENRKGQAASDLESQWTYTPRLIGDDARPRAIERLIDATDTNGGAVFDPHALSLNDAFPVAAKYGGAQTGYGVAANMGTIARVTLEEWQANAPAILEGVLTDPAHADQIAHPDVRIGTWVHAGDDGRMLVDIDLSQGTHGGQKLTRDQARTLGLARSQDAIFDNGRAVADGVDPDTAFPDIYLSKDPKDQAIATHLREHALNPRSGFSRYTSRLRKAIDSVIESSQASGVPTSVDHAWGDAYVDAAARLGQTAVNNGRFESIDKFFAHMDVQFAKRVDRNNATLYQTVLGLEPGPALDRALVEVKGVEEALRWYDDSHAAIEKRWRLDRQGNERMTTLLDGTQRPTADLLYDLIAVTSVMASPTENMGRALSGLANLEEWMAGQKNATAAAERALAKLERLNTDKVKMGGKEVSRRLAESIGKELTADTSMIGAPLYNVFDILEGRLDLTRADADLLRSLPERWTGERRALSAANVPDELVGHHREQGALEGLQGPELEAYAQDRALMEHHGSNALAKLRSFRDNLANPDLSRAVTLDSWMARMLGVPSTDFGKTGVYGDIAQKIRATADQATAAGHPMTPHQLQALLWVFTKTEIGHQDFGRFLAATDATVELIRRGEWTPDLDPTLHDWFDMNLGPSRESTKNPTMTEAPVETIRGRSDVADVGGGTRQTETRRSIPFDAKTLASKEKAVDNYRTFQATIAEKIAAGDIDGAEKAYLGWAAKQRKNLVGPDGNLHFGVLDENAGRDAAINTATGRLEKLDKGPSDIDPVVNGYFRKFAKKRGLKRPTAVDPETVVPAERGRAISDAYAALESDPKNPEVRKAYRALTTEVDDQWRFMTEDPDGPQLQVTFVDRADNPYVNGTEDVAEMHQRMLDDVRDNNHLYVDKTGPDELHPVWTPEQNDRFRAVHDYFGHSRVGNDFGRNGEEVAYQLHAQMFSDEANKVLPTETRGQNSYLNFSPENEARRAAGEQAQFPEQKAGILPEWARDIPTEGDPTTLYQKFHDKIAGSFTPAEATQTGRAIIRLFEGADPTTMPHELGHMLYYLLDDADLKVLDSNYKGVGVLKQFHPKGTAQRVAMEEGFANDFSSFLISKQAPSRQLGIILDKVRSGIFNLWEGMRTSLFKDRIPGAVHDVLDRWYEPEVEALPVPDMVSDISKLPTDQTPRQLGQSLPAHPNETPVVARRRGYRAGRAVERMESIDRQIRDTTIRKARLAKGIADMEKVMAEHQLPSELAQAVIEGHVQRNINKLADGLDNPSIARTPAHLKPLWGAIKGLYKEAENNAPLAQALESIPETFPDMLRWLAANGVTPEHVSSMTNSRVSQLVYEAVQLGHNGRIGKVAEAATRKTRQGAFAEARGIDALAAGYLQGPHEANSNALVNYLEDVHVRDVPRNAAGKAEIPNGYRAWDPERNFILRGERSDSGFELAGKGAQPTKMIPDAVAKTIDKYSRDYSHGLFKLVGNVTNPWRALVLTWSPRWYVNNFVGNTVLATAEGVRMRDWVQAWKSYRQRGEAAGIGQRGKRLAAPFADVPEVTNASIVGEIGGQPHVVPYPETHPTPRHPLGGKDGGVAMANRTGGKLEAYNQVAHKLARANEVVDEIARAAVYHRSLRTGVTREMALTRSFEALVDYGNLTPFERQVVRSVVPFYSWQKGILKIVTKMAIDHPVAAGITLQLSELNRELNIEQYGADLPQAYKGLVDLPGIGTINTRGFNPFQDSTQLLTPQGIAASVNPFLEIGVRNALGAPEGGFVKHQKVNEFGTVVPDTSPAEDLGGIGTGLPQYQLGAGLLGDGAYKGAPTGVQAAERFVGIPAYRPDQVRKIIARSLKSAKRTKT